MAALLTSETGNTEKVVKYIREARDMSITVLPPDVNSSDLYFTPVGEAVRFGLAAIKNVGENTVRGIVAAREKLGGFRSLFQFCDSVDARLLNRRVLESLIKSGAMDSLGGRRAQLFAVIDRAMERAQRFQRESSTAQHGLFRGGGATPEPAEPALPDCEEWAEHELLAAEFATLGFYISGHPLAKHAARLKELRAVELSGVEGKRNGEDITIAGIVVAMRAMRSRKGDRWAILTVQDMTGVLEVLAFPEAFARFENVLKSDAPLLLRGRVNVEEAGTRVSVQEARLLDQVAEGNTFMRVRVDLGAVDEGLLDRLKELFAGSPGPCAVAFDLLDPDGSVATLRSNQRVRLDERLVDKVREMCGADAVEVVR
jgi:DNA polymerase-3 subunit alpha